VLVCYNFVKRLTDKDGDQSLLKRKDLFANGTITLLKEKLEEAQRKIWPLAYLDHFHICTDGESEVEETPSGTKVQDKKIAAWTFPKTK
jgi:hypothetical protein